MRVKSIAGIAGLGAATLLFTTYGCGSSSESAQLTAAGGAHSGSAVGGSGGAGASGLTSSGPGAGGDEGCAQDEAEATLVNKPVDIIFVIDNSGSMSDEIEEVEVQINKNFAAIINAAVPPIDYRVVMVSRFGSYSNNRICVAEPLGGIPDTNNDGHCDSLPSQPVNTANFFHHSVSIGSHNALCRLLEQYQVGDSFGLQPDGYHSVLRDDAFKFFVVITDDGVSCSFDGKNYNDGNNVSAGQTSAAAWDLDLMALSPQQFGTDPLNRNYAFWSIIAIEPHMPSMLKPYGDPHPPDATLSPITTAKCTPSAVDPGTGYQGLSIMTGGYRYPTCGLEYSDIFQLMAQGVIEGAQVPCEFDIPDPPPGETLDLSTVVVVYTSGGTPVSDYTQVPSLADCNDSSFYIDMDKIHLCPGACSVVQADEDAKINIKYGCEVGVPQ